MAYTKKAKNKIGVAHVFLFYWIVLVAWQNLSSASLRSGFDLVLKLGLIFLLTAFYLFRAQTISRNIVSIFLLALSLLITLWLTGDSFSGNNLISYAYPVLLAFLAFGVGNNFQINKKEFLFFLNGIIVVTLYAAIYAVLFRTNQFRMAFSYGYAYGNELTSFFTSNHEYGMYLVYAIVACIVQIEVKRNELFKKKILYFIAIVIFVPNLVLTFSRTALLSMAVIVFVYCFINAQAKLRKWMITAVILLIVAVLAIPKLQNFVILALFKGQDGLGARGDLYQFAIDVFKEGTPIQKLFGYGMGIRNVFEKYVNHGSVHNAYLQVVMYFGLVGFVFFMALLMSQLLECIRMYHESKFYSVIFCILLLAAMAMMFTNTAIVFTSPIDSFFLTVVAILVPKYVRNSIHTGAFDIDTPFLVMYEKKDEGFDEKGRT